MSIDPKVHFRILEDIATNLSSEVNFPTSLDAAVMVRNVLQDPEVAIEKVVEVIGVEALIATKLLRIANSVSYNPSGRTITDLKTAITLLGFATVRTTSLAVAMDQMLKSRNLAAFDNLSKQIWEHSLYVSAIARVLARRIGRVSAEEAMLSGIVHHIGIFYLLYRAAEYPEYRGNQASVIELVSGWHESIGESLLHLLGLPERIVMAVRDHSHVHRQNGDDHCNLRDILYFANLLAGGHPEWMPAFDTPSEAEAAERERYADLLEEAAEDIAALRAALG